MNSATQERFLQYLLRGARTDAPMARLLIKLRVINSQWNKFISEAEPIGHYLRLSAGLKKILYYDKSVYDQFSYQREILLATLLDERAQYIGLLTPVLRECVSDLDENERIEFVDWRPINNEVRLFFEYYIRNPIRAISIFPPGEITISLQKQTARLRSERLGFQDRDNTPPVFLPMCYAVVGRSVAVLSYVNQLCDNPDGEIQYVVHAVGRATKSGAVDFSAICDHICGLVAQTDQFTIDMDSFDLESGLTHLIKSPPELPSGK
jgi:hypothetical protein